MASDTFTFTIESKAVPVVRQLKDRITKLFNVQVEFTDVFANKLQWISLEDGNVKEEPCGYIEAKEYILALVEPEITLSQDNVRLTDRMRDDIERKSAARLEVKNGMVSIKGTQMNVGMAKSLLDSMAAVETESHGGYPSGNDKKNHERPARQNGPTQQEGSHQPSSYLNYLSGQSGYGVSNVCRTPPPPDLTRVALKGNPVRKTQSPQRKPPAQPNFNPSPNAGHPMAEESYDSNCTSQESYLKTIGLSSGFTIMEIKEALSQFDVDDVIKPMEFLAALEQLRLINAQCREASHSNISSQLTPSTIRTSPSGPTSNLTYAAASSHHPQPPPPPSAFQRHSSGHKQDGEHQDAMSAVCRTLSMQRISASKNKGQLRYVVIDGSNVAMSHGRSKVFSVRGILICLKYFLDRGHEVTAFVPESRRYKKNPIPIADRHLLDELEEADLIVFTPARRIDGKVIACYDDRYVLNLANEHGGIVVSNDQFRDLLDAKDGYRDIIINRLLSYKFVGDLFMPPDDPLGPRGPFLDEFLQMPGTLNAARSRQPQGLSHNNIRGRGKSVERPRNHRHYQR